MVRKLDQSHRENVYRGLVLVTEDAQDQEKGDVRHHDHADEVCRVIDVALVIVDQDLAIEGLVIGHVTEDLVHAIEEDQGHVIEGIDQNLSNDVVARVTVAVLQGVHHVIVQANLNVTDQKVAQTNHWRGKKKGLEYHRQSQLKTNFLTRNALVYYLRRKMLKQGWWKK